MLLPKTFQTCENVSQTAVGQFVQRRCLLSFQRTKYWIIITFLHNLLCVHLHILCQFPSHMLLELYTDEFWGSRQVTTDFQTHSLNVPTLSWIISIWKISCFQCHTANSILQFGILFQPVFFFVPPPLLFFQPLLLISIHCATALWILSGPLPFSSSPAKLKWFLLENMAWNDSHSPLWLVEEVHRTVRQVTTTSTFSHFEACATESWLRVAEAGVTVICASVLIRE